MKKIDLTILAICVTMFSFDFSANQTHSNDRNSNKKYAPMKKGRRIVTIKMEDFRSEAVGLNKEGFGTPVKLNN